MPWHAIGLGWLQAVVQAYSGWMHSSTVRDPQGWHVQTAALQTAVEEGAWEHPMQLRSSSFTRASQFFGQLLRTMTRKEDCPVKNLLGQLLWQLAFAFEDVLHQELARDRRPAGDELRAWLLKLHQLPRHAREKSAAAKMLALSEYFQGAQVVSMATDAVRPSLKSRLNQAYFTTLGHAAWGVPQVVCSLLGFSIPKNVSSFSKRGPWVPGSSFPWDSRVS